MNIVFVCNANMFRSVSAHYSLQKYLEDNDIKGISVMSAGIIAKNGEKADSNIVSKFKKEYGYDISKHRSTVFSREVIENADLIVAMAKNHQDFIAKNYCIDVPLFNEIAYNKKTDIADNVDVVEDIVLNRDKFIEYEDKILNYIFDSIPEFVLNVKKYVNKFHSIDNCKFCRFIHKKDLLHKNKFPFSVVYETKYSISFLSVDIPKNQNLHVLVVPKKHYVNLEDMPKRESTDLLEHLKVLVRKIRERHGGCNILLNDGGVAGQFIFHTHFHVFPRDKNDNMNMEAWDRGVVSKVKFIKMSEELSKLLINL